MKLYSIMLILFVSSTFYTCDKVKDLADVNFDTDVVTTLAIASSNTNNQTFTTVLDATSDSEISKYASKIKGYEVREIWFAIENYASAAEGEIYFNGDLGFSSKDKNTPDASCSVSNLNVTHWTGTGEFQINNCNSTLSEIAEAFSQDNAVKVYMTGSFTKAPLNFNLKIRMKVKVTANPL